MPQTDAEWWASLNPGVGQIDPATATDAELAAAVAALQAELALKQPANVGATDAEVAAAVADAIAARAALRIGEEVGYAERWLSATTQQTGETDALLNANLIPGLTFDVMGEGRPVEVEFVCPLVAHSVAGGVCYGVLMLNGTRWQYSPAVLSKAGAGSFLVVKRRAVLPAGVNHAFTVAMTLDVAGTGTYYADEPAKVCMYLSAVSR